MLCVQRTYKLQYLHSKLLLRWTGTMAAKKVNECDFFERFRNTLKCDKKDGFVVPYFKKALLYPNNIAIKDVSGEYSYFQLYMTAKKLSIQISNICGSASLSKVAYLCSNTAIPIVLQWGCWLSGQIVIPLVNTSSVDMQKHILNDAKVRMIIATVEYESIAKELALYFDIVLLVVDHSFIVSHNNEPSAIKREILIGKENRALLAGTLTNDFYTNADAIILYSSKKFFKPVGVILTHMNLNAQSESLLTAWKCTENDSFLHALPQSYTNSYFNSILCPLSIGGKILMHENFNGHNVWKTILGINTPAKDRVNVFIGVPAMYISLLSEYEKIFAKNSQMVEYIKNFCKSNFRLMVSGSAPLNETVFNRWKEITGHKIIERYGMIETGIVLSNPYYECYERGKMRKPGVAGFPLPGVELQIVDTDDNIVFRYECDNHKAIWNVENKNEVSTSNEQENSKCKQDLIISKISGKLEIGGKSVFKGYHNQPELTEAALNNGFFKTGDDVLFENGVFMITENTSADVINTCGHRVCCLEIETALSSHPGIKEVVVVGVPDSTCGERIGAICVVVPEYNLDLNELTDFCSGILPIYKHPSMLKIVHEIPRNDLLKAKRKELSTLFN